MEKLTFKSTVSLGNDYYYSNGTFDLPLRNSDVHLT